MEEKDISGLIDRFEHMLQSGKNTYFDADEYDELADYYDKLDDIETAKKIVDLGLEMHPDNELLMLRYARILVYDSCFSEALQYMDSNFSSYDFDLYLLKIECFLQLGLYAEAYSLTEEVLTDEDTDPEVMLSELGFLYVEAEYYDEAILYFERSLEYDPENIDVLGDLAYAYEGKGDFEQAIKICELILDADPYSIEAWLMLGKLHSLREEYGKAIDAFDFALTLEEDNVNILRLKAHCLILSDRIEEALDILKQCLELVPDDSSTYLTCIDCYMNLGQYDKMLDAVSDYESQFGVTSESYTKKAFAFLLKEDIANSQKMIDEALILDPDSSEANLVAGDLYFRLDRLALAEDYYQKALLLKGPESEDVLEKLILVFIHKGDLNKAIKYQEVLADVTKSDTSQKKLALLYLESGKKEMFKSYVNTFSNDTLLSFLQVFYPDEQINLSTIDRSYIMKRLDDIFEYRLLYRNIKY